MVVVANYFIFNLYFFFDLEKVLCVFCEEHMLLPFGPQ